MATLSFSNERTEITQESFNASSHKRTYIHPECHLIFQTLKEFTTIIFSFCLLGNCIINWKKNKYEMTVRHALHFLSNIQYIIWNFQWFYAITVRKNKESKQNYELNRTNLREITLVLRWAPFLSYKLSDLFYQIHNRGN